MRNPFLIILYRLIQKILFFTLKIVRWPKHEMIAGKSSLFSITEILIKYRKKHVLVVIGPNVVKLGQIKDFLGQLENNKIKYTLFNEVKSEPSALIIERAVRAYKTNQCRAIIAIGGGSQIDCAKMVAAKIARPKKELIKMAGYMKVRRKLPLLIAVPTTSGSGSEATACAVISVPKREKGNLQAEAYEKKAVMDTVLLPRYAVLDPLLTLSAPKTVTAYSGMDALIHVLEAYIGRACSPKTAYEAEWAFKLIIENLYDSYGAGDDYVSRKNMQEGAYYAGKVFTKSFVGYIHAFAHAIGGQYNLPHGRVIATVAPFILKWYGKKIIYELSRLASIMEYETPSDGDKVKADWFIAKLEELNNLLGIPDKISELREDDIPGLAKNIIHEANPIYPVPKVMFRKECEKLLHDMMS